MLALGWVPDFRWFNSSDNLQAPPSMQVAALYRVVPEAGAVVTIFVTMKESLCESRNHREKALLRDVGRETGPWGGVWGHESSHV